MSGDAQHIRSAAVYALIVSFLLCSMNFSLQGQVRVMNDHRKEYRFPWTGGMNSCQFGEVDLNLDQVMDLIIFDRSGNRIVPLVNKGTPGQTDYEYAPEYRSAFPGISDWMILADYDQDGRRDIFTYSPGYAGIKVFRNTSAKALEFTPEVYPYLTSHQGGGFTNILVTYADYPAICDLDQDGDLDILTFWGLGSFIDMHKNQSVEKYGVPDSLDFFRVTGCWGYLAESEESNVVYLDTCFIMRESGGYRHTGSTFFVRDLNGDLLPELVLGDVDYPQLMSMTNGGTIEDAFMISIDSLFPAPDHPVRLFSMPSAIEIDINNDQKKDLLVAPFDPNPIVSENYRSVWLYHNTGTNDLPVYHFEEPDFLQSDMIDVGSGSAPILQDADGDGLTDLFISNYGYYQYSWYLPGMLLKSKYTSSLALFLNAGTAEQPVFELVTRDFGGLYSLGKAALHVAFGDIDGDSDIDLITGQEDGRLIFLKNLSGDPGQFDFAAPQDDYQQVDVGSFSTPQLFDLDQDGLSDLVIGEQNGNLNYYKNTGSYAQPVFDLETDSLGKVNVTDYNLSFYGYSVPFFFRWMGQTQLLVGSEKGKVFYFKDIDGNLTGKFSESDSLFSLIGTPPGPVITGIRSSADICDLDSDGWPELVAGNFSGGLVYLPEISLPPVAEVSEPEPNETRIAVFPNPVKNTLNVIIPPASSGSRAVIHCFTPSGRLIFSRSVSISYKFQMDVSGLSSGVYFLSVFLTQRNGNFSRFHGRFVKSE